MPFKTNWSSQGDYFVMSATLSNCGNNEIALFSDAVYLTSDAYNSALQPHDVTLASSDCERLLHASVQSNEGDLNCDSTGFKLPLCNVNPCIVTMCSAALGVNCHCTGSRGAGEPAVSRDCRPQGRAIAMCSERNRGARACPCRLQRERSGKKANKREQTSVCSS